MLQDVLLFELFQRTLPNPFSFSFKSTYKFSHQNQQVRKKAYCPRTAPGGEYTFFQTSQQPIRVRHDLKTISHIIILLTTLQITNVLKRSFSKSQRTSLWSDLSSAQARETISLKIFLSLTIDGCSFIKLFCYECVIISYWEELLQLTKVADSFGFMHVSACKQVGPCRFRDCSEFLRTFVDVASNYMYQSDQFFGCCSAFEQAASEPGFHTTTFLMQTAELVNISLKFWTIYVLLTNFKLIKGSIHYPAGNLVIYTDFLIFILLFLQLGSFSYVSLGMYLARGVGTGGHVPPNILKRMKVLFLFERI